MANLFSNKNEFIITIEVVPPQGSCGDDILEKLSSLEKLSFNGFSVASNPVAKSKMSAMVFSHLIQKITGKPAILHCTIRDHNRLGLQSGLWGAKALGIDTVIAVTGDPSASGADTPAQFVADLSVFELITLIKDSNFYTGAVLDFRPEINGLDHEIRRLEKKIAAGCQFAVTQPLYDKDTAQAVLNGTDHLKIPVIMGILPLLSYKHARFLHDKVDGIAIPKSVQQQMEKSENPLNYGVSQAKEMLDMAKTMFSGACIMPAFDRYEILKDILSC